MARKFLLLKGFGVREAKWPGMLGLVGMGAAAFVPLVLVAVPALTGRFWGELWKGATGGAGL